MYLLWILTIVITITEAIDMTFTNKWKPNFGWELLCSWSFSGTDHLMSVRFTRDKAQFMIFRPKDHGQRRYETFYTEDSAMSLECIEQNSHAGLCLLKIEPIKPPVNINRYSCEVSGERPHFKLMSRDLDLEPYVPTNDTNIIVQDQNTSNRVLLNCSATGLPAPRLTLRAERRTLAPDFTSKIWNSTSKLFHVWSTVTLTPSADDITVTCNPEQRSGRGVESPTPATYTLSRSSGGRHEIRDNMMFSCIIFFWILLRYSL